MNRVELKHIELREDILEKHDLVDGRFDTTIDEIAKEFGTSRYHINQAFPECNFSKRHTKRSKEVTKLLHEGMSLTEIATQLGISRQRVWQIATKE